MSHHTTMSDHAGENRGRSPSTQSHLDPTGAGTARLSSLEEKIK